MKPFGICYTWGSSRNARRVTGTDPQLRDCIRHGMRIIAPIGPRGEGRLLIWRSGYIYTRLPGYDGQISNLGEG